MFYLNKDKKKIMNPRDIYKYTHTKQFNSIKKSDFGNNMNYIS